MAQALVCQFCRTWFENSNARARCPSCGRRQERSAAVRLSRRALAPPIDALQAPANLESQRVERAPLREFVGAGLLFLDLVLLVVAIAIHSQALILLAALAFLITAGVFALGHFGLWYRP